jgi:Fe-S-cluster containining protein
LTAFACRRGCGACCIAPSISSPLPGAPAGKAASFPCPHLSPDYACSLFGRPERPAVCASLQARADMCGVDRSAALAYLAGLELATRP